MARQVRPVLTMVSEPSPYRQSTTGKQRTGHNAHAHPYWYLGSQRTRTRTRGPTPTTHYYIHQYQYLHAVLCACAPAPVALIGCTKARGEDTGHNAHDRLDYWGGG